jgi:hypothetical protein
VDQIKRPDGQVDDFPPGSDDKGVVHLMTEAEARADAIKRRAFERAFEGEDDGAQPAQTA